MVVPSEFAIGTCQYRLRSCAGWTPGCRRRWCRRATLVCSTPCRTGAARLRPPSAAPPRLRTDSRRRRKRSRAPSCPAPAPRITGSKRDALRHRAIDVFLREKARPRRRPRPPSHPASTAASKTQVGHQHRVGDAPPLRTARHHLALSPICGNPLARDKGRRSTAWRPASARRSISSTLTAAGTSCFVLQAIARADFDNFDASGRIWSIGQSIARRLASALEDGASRTSLGRYRCNRVANPPAKNRVIPCGRANPATNPPISTISARNI